MRNLKFLPLLFVSLCLCESAFAEASLLDNLRNLATRSGLSSDAVAQMNMTQIISNAAALPGNTWQLGTAGSTTGSLLLTGSTSGTVTLTVAAAAGTWTMKLPTADGTNGQVIKTNGSGQLSFTSAGAGDAITTNPLSQFAATPSAQLAGVLSDETGTGLVVFATSPTLVTPILGTPTSGTLTNCTGLPVAGITASTSTALGVGSIELGHASDTTIARSAAGAITVEGVAVPTISSTSTLTNKWVQPRLTTITSSATPTVNTDNCDCVRITAQAAAITSVTTNLSGTPVACQKLLFEILDDGTARAITWGASFASGPATLPTTTTVNKILYTGFIWSAARSKWICIATGSEQ